MEIKIEVPNNKITEALILSSALIKEQLEDKDLYLYEARQAIVELHKDFVRAQNKYTDKHFLILKRLLLALDHYDDVEELKEYKAYSDRCDKLNYKTLDRFDERGLLIED